MERFLRYFKDSDSFAEAAAREIASLLVESVEARGRASIALAGGNTPKPVYERLAALYRVPWDQVDVFLGDERMVPPDSEQSNMRMARIHLLQSLKNPAPRIHAVDTSTAEAAEAAAAYDAEVAGVLDAEGAVAGSGRFDLVLLGMGADGHTASLFPDAAALQETEARVAPVAADEISEGMSPRVDRVTLTLRAINEAHCALFLVSGEDKLELFRAMELGEPEALALPAARVSPRECLVWYLLQP